MSNQTVTLDEFQRLSAKARNDLLTDKSDSTMLKYLQGQVKDHITSTEHLRIYARLIGLYSTVLTNVIGRTDP